MNSARCVDALNPEPTHFTLACATVAEGVLPCVHDGFVCGPKAAAPVSVITLCLAEYGAALLLCVNSTLDTCHWALLLLDVTKNQLRISDPVGLQTLLA
jgi:hypothetical protein